MVQTLITAGQLGSAVLLTGAILLQQKGAGLSGVFGGGSNIYSTKRGIDKVLHYLTIGTAIIFFGFSLLRLLL